ncbi:MAG: hypothetical protein ABIG46_00470 [Candidatus Omnitrophota bacterium]|nr:hypothetical protein [Candidatus Omnitrophota bacterium]
MKIKIIFYILAIVLIGGCASGYNTQGLLMLKRLGDNQKGIEVYIESQVKGLSRLRKDIVEGRLGAEIIKQDIADNYLEPIVCRDVKGKERCLYRHPTKYFNTPRVYLFFNKEEKLLSWKLQPAGE